VVRGPSLRGPGPQLKPRSPPPPPPPPTRPRPPGDLDKDAFAPRLFVDNGLEVVVAQSYSKVGGGERGGVGGGGVGRAIEGALLQDSRERPHGCLAAGASPHPCRRSRARQNLGLYGERVGALNFVLADAEVGGVC
jgi:hypothetical protein